jgi:hypothetical protein
MEFLVSKSSDYENNHGTVAKPLTQSSFLSLPPPFLPLLSIIPVLGVQVRESEVEEWVVEAIRLGLIDARMDQSGQEVRVASAVHREFGAEQWPILQGRIRAWRDSVAAYLQTLKAARKA